MLSIAACGKDNEATPGEAAHRIDSKARQGEVACDGDYESVLGKAAHGRDGETTLSKVLVAEMVRLDE